MHPCYQPDFSTKCIVCGATPCVVVIDHVCPDTNLCGPHFFHDRSMVEWEAWNDEMESTE